MHHQASRTHSAPSWFTLYGEPFVLVTAIAMTVQALVAGWRDQFFDFSIFLASASAMRSGLDPYATIRVWGYGPNTNPPLIVWVLRPLTYLPFGVAIGLWTVLSALAMLWTVRLIHRVTGHGPVLLGVVLMTQAAVLTPRLGQIAWLLMPLATLAWLADREGRSAIAGAWLGPLAYMKPFYGLYLMYFAWRRDWRACAGMCASGVACAVAGLLTTNIETHRSWLATLSGLRRQGHSLNGSARGVAARVFNPDIVQPYPIYTVLANSPVAEQVTFWLLVLAIAFVVWRALQTADRDQAWAILGIVAVLCSPLGWIYYLPISLGPIATVIVREQRWRLAGVGVLLLSVPFSVLAMGHFGMIGTLTVGSVFWWGTVAWFAAVLPPQRAIEGDQP
jgi:alpha-1,2-mannosyltransferase